MGNEVTTDESNSSLPSSPLPYAVLDHIVLDYRFRTPNLTELYDGSQSQEPLLPLKELLDPALQRLVCIHFIRQLPLVFGCWNDVLEDEAFLSKRIGRAIRRIVARSKDPIFKRHLQQSTGNICRNINKLCDHLLEQLVDNDEALTEEASQPNNVGSIISRSLLVTSQAHFRPKPLKRKVNVHSFDERDMPEEPQTTIHDQVSEQDAEILPELDTISPLESEQNSFQDDNEYSSAGYDEFHETGPHTSQLDSGSIQSLDSNNLKGAEDKDLYKTNTSSITAYSNEDGSDEKNLLAFEDEDPDQVSGLEQHSTDDDMIFD